MATDVKGLRGTQALLKRHGFILMSYSPGASFYRGEYNPQGPAVKDKDHYSFDGKHWDLVKELLLKIDELQAEVKQLKKST